MSLLLTLRDIFMAGFATFCFAILFCVPPKHYFACGFNGSVAWAMYLLSLQLQPSVVVATLCASFPLTILARVFAMRQKAPVTVFLFCGIFPLVPGAGIYYTAYYFMQGEHVLCLSTGIETLKIAIALAIGISIVLGMPLPKAKARVAQEEES